MPINAGDRFKLMCYLGKLDDIQKFVAAFQRQQSLAGEKVTDEESLKKNLLRWNSGAALNSSNEEVLVAALQASGWPRRIPAPDQLLQRRESVPAFLALCHLSYPEVEHLLSEESKLEWKDRHFGLHFMKTLEACKNDPKAKLLAKDMIGTYRLYRRHSILPGLLREHFVISQYTDGHWEGHYIQYARARSPNIIPFNVFFCEFYLMAFGAHKASLGRAEIVTVSVLIENAFSGNRRLRCDDYNRYFTGLLNGIYDYGNILLAERILIERISGSGSTALDKPEMAPRHIRSDEPQQEYAEEYARVINAVDNLLDGQTLTSRPSLLELVLK
jgi:hypothetical protein